MLSPKSKKVVPVKYDFAASWHKEPSVAFVKASPISEHFLVQLSFVFARLANPQQNEQ